MGNKFLPEKAIYHSLENLLYFLDKTFWASPWLVLLFAATIFLIVMSRYLLMSGLYIVFIRLLWNRTYFRSARHQKQFKNEVIWSALSSVVFTILAVLTYWIYQRGLTEIYTDLSQYPLWYFYASPFIFLFLYETYYYWLHRWMHKPGVFEIVHKVHHKSIHPSVFTSFSFHPVESLLQFVFIPIVLIIIPMHYYALGAALILMTISAIINHAGVEIYPKKFRNHPIGKWFIGSTHHDLHHQEFKTNYGLCFTFWDKWMNTESKNYASSFQDTQVTLKK